LNSVFVSAKLIVCIVEIYACCFDTLSELGALVATGLSCTVVDTAKECLMSGGFKAVNCLRKVLVHTIHQIRVMIIKNKVEFILLNK
jgi:hypothetical protein